MTKTNILMVSLGSGALSTVLGITSVFIKASNYGVSGNLIAVATMIGLFGLVSGFVGYAYPSESVGTTGTTTYDVSKGA